MKKHRSAYSIECDIEDVEAMPQTDETRKQLKSLHRELGDSLQAELDFCNKPRQEVYKEQKAELKQVNFRIGQLKKANADMFLKAAFGIFKDLEHFDNVSEELAHLVRKRIKLRINSI